MEVARTDTSFDPRSAARYGGFVALAYAMHGADPGNAAPSPLPAPAGFKFIAWVQMRDFVVASGDWAFYGLIAQSTDDPDRFVLAIRGTSSPEEWWDDLASAVLAPWSGPGLVGFGFNRIYQTLRVVDLPPPPSLTAMASPVPAEAGSFPEQVAATLGRHASAARPAPSATAAAVPARRRTLVVAGHSLGAALSTLYMADHAAKAGEGGSIDGVEVTASYTFASPRVGNPVFAAAFDALSVSSWRVVNELDVVPKLPVIGFEHVDRLQSYNSGTMVRWSAGCWHSLQTYLHLLDPKQPLDPGCSRTVAATAAMAAVAPPAAQVRGAWGRTRVFGPAVGERHDDHRHDQGRLTLRGAGDNRRCNGVCAEMLPLADAAPPSRPRVSRLRRLLPT